MKTFLRKMAKAVLSPLYFLLYYMSGLFPRDNKIWVFGSAGGRRFADNGKWFFLQCNESETKDIRCIWITEDEKTLNDINKLGLEVYYKYSLKAAFFCLRAGVYLYDAYVREINFVLSRNSIKVNIWHGSPLKKIEHDINRKDNMFYRAFHGSPLDNFKYLMKRPDIFVKGSFMVSTSKYVGDRFATAFNIEKSKVLLTGYPRNDILSAKYSASEKFLICEDYKKLKELKDSNKKLKIITYLPTSRSVYINFDLNSFWSNLSSFLGKTEDVIFVYKPHINDKLDKSSSDNEKIKLLNPKTDIYPILRLTDLLITDYSSVYFDYMITDKPVLFFPFDYDEYYSKVCDLYADYNEETPGIKAKSSEELFEILNRYLDNFSALKTTNYEKIKKKYNFYDDNLAGQRLFSELKSRIL